MGPATPATVRRGDARMRAVVVWCAALLASLGVLVPVAPAGFTVPGSPHASGPAHGPAAAGVPEGGDHHGTHGDRAGAQCTSVVACDDRPRLHRAGPADRIVGASGTALLPARLLPAAPGKIATAPSPACGATHVGDVRCPDGRAPPLPTGI